MLPILNLLVALVTYSPVSNNSLDNHQFCAHNHVQELHFGQHIEQFEKHIKLEKDLKKAIQNDQIAAYRALYTLPVVVHVIHNNGSENISDAQVLQGIDDLNAAFANSGYYDQNTGLDTDIQFCLAKRDPDGNPTTGINRVSSGLTSLTLETQDIAMKDLSRWNPLEYINIWVVGEICSASVGCGVAGYAFFPASHGMPEDGLVVEASYFGNSQANSAVIAHEMGHYLGLYHTFQDGCGNNDCLSDGDRVCDTPPDQSTAPVPCGQDVNSCTTDVNAADPNNPFTTDQNDMYWNYMDYGDLDCYSAFTPGQVDRMYFFINSARNSLLMSDGCMDPCLNPLNIAFQASATNIEAGTTVNFTNTSTNANSFDWQINGTTFASSANTSYTFNQVGTYTITLIGANGSPFCENDFSIEISVECNTVANFEASANLIGVGESVNFNNTSVDASSYSWTVNGNPEANSNNFSFTFSSSDIFEICLTAQGQYCSDTYCGFVVVTEELDECEGGNGSFLKTFQSANPSNQGHAIIPSGDGNLIIGGRTGNESILMKCTPQGEVIWNKKIDFAPSAPEQILHFSFDSEGMLLGIGYGGNTAFDRVSFNFRFNVQTEQFIWMNVNNSGSVTNRKIYEKEPGGDIVVFGQNQGNPAPGSGCDATIYHFDRNTGVETAWKKHYQMGSCETFQDAYIYDNDIFVTGRYNYAGGGTSRMRSSASRINFDGSVQWTRSYLVGTSTDARLYSPDMLIQNDEIVILHIGDKNGTSADNAEVFVTKSDMNGVLMWAKEYTLNSNTIIRASQIIALPDGYAIIGSNNSNNRIFILKIDNEGNQIWAKEYGLTESMFVSGAGTEMILENIYLYFTGWRGDQLMLGRVSFLDGVLNSDCPEEEDISFTVNDFSNPFQGPQNLIEYNTSINHGTISPSDGDLNLIVTNLCESGPADAVVDMELIDCDETTLEIELEICNEGESTLSQATPVTFYIGNPTLIDAPVLITLSGLPIEIPAGECITFPFPVPAAFDEEIFVVINDDGSLDRPFDLENDFPIGDPTECVFLNNMASLTVEGGFPPLDLGPDVEMCDNGIVNLDAGEGYETYEWSTLESTSSITVFDEGTYTVTVTFGCVTLVDSITISIDPATVIDAGPDLVACSDQGVSITANGDFERFKWTPSDFLDCDTCQTVFAMPDTVVTYTVIGTNESGCISVDTVTINFGLVSVFDTIPLCFGESTMVFGQEVSGDGTYVDTVFNEMSCDTAFSVTTIEFSQISLSANTTPTCFEDSTGVASFEVSGGVGPYTLAWDQRVLDSTTLLNLPQGSYEISITDANNCETTAVFEIESVPDVNVDLNPFDISCFEANDGMIEISNASNGLLFSLDGINYSNTTSFDSLMPGDYTLYYQDEFGCEYETYFSLFEPEEVVASIPEVDLIPLGDEVTLKVTTNAQEPVSYIWSPGDILDCDTCQSVTALPLFNGVLSVLVIDGNGCTAVVTVDLYILKNRKVYIPNVFSPNDDGFNDRFTIFGSQEVDKIIELEIYDRWGERIFEGKDLAANDESAGWDGKFKGKMMNNAAFVYITKVRFIDGEERIYKGDVILMR